MSVPDEATANLLTTLLTAMVHAKASDVHLRAGGTPKGRVAGVFVEFASDPERPDQFERLTPDQVADFTRIMMNSDHRWEEFRRVREADFAYGLPGLARFRVNAYWQRGSVGLVMRVIEDKSIPDFEELGLPLDTFGRLCEHERGLILVTGPTGSGKTTTLASMLDHINATASVNIVTLEDPIEVLHKDKKSTISQRELGSDTLSFGAGLRAAMRQDPDVILIGEMRDKETVEAALSAAQTGHLVFSTLHTMDAMKTVSRIIDFFAPHERGQIRLGLSESLVGIVSQRLLPRLGGGRVLGMEIVVATGTVRDCVKEESKMEDLKQAVQEGSLYGMQTFDQHLVSLVRGKQLSQEEAMAAASSPQEVKIELMKDRYAD